MAAIITQNFRLDTTQKFVSGLGNTTYYLGLGRPNPWADDTIPPIPNENEYTTNNAWENMYALKKLEADDAISACPRHLWVSGNNYKSYDDRTLDPEAGIPYYVITNNNHVYLCLRNGPGNSVKSPDDTGAVSGIINYEVNDGYIWKYLYSVSTSNGSKFLTESFIPVLKLESNPGAGAETALQTQWSIQENAVNGAIYNVVIENGGSGFTTIPTLTVEGNGTGCEVECTIDVAGSIDTVRVKTNFAGQDYGHATIVISGGGGSGAVIRAIIGPDNGFGADPRVDLRAHYACLNKKFSGTESGAIVAADDFRQILLVKEPIDQSTDVVALASMYNTTHTMITDPGPTYTGAYSADDIIKGSNSGALGRVVEEKVYDSTANTWLIRYLQNEDTGYTPFENSEVVRAEAAASGGQDIDSVSLPEVKHGSGSMVFIENREPVNRGPDQIETIRLVIEF